MPSRTTAAKVATLAAVLLAVGILVVTLFPGLLVGSPGEYNRTTVTTYDADGTRQATVRVRIADTFEKRYTGLSETESLAMGEGMLFVHEEEARHAYVMRNMSFPLDIVFIDANGTVTAIFHASVDGDDAPYEARGKYVLEVPRGWANRTDLEVGDTVEIPTDV